MKNFLYLVSFLTLLLIAPSLSWAIIPIPAKIGGSVTVDGEVITSVNDDGYTVVVTKADGTAYIPAAEDTDGFTPKYSLDIPMYDATDQPGGAISGETAIIHLYIGDTELTITSPTDGQIAVDEGNITEHNLVAYSSKTLTIQDPDNGSITASPSSADNTYAHGTEVTLTAEPDIYYVFDSWTGDVTDAHSATTTIIMDDDQTVTASFSQCFYTLTMAVNDEQMGDITLPATGIGDSEKACGSDVTITATPEVGYFFTGWTGDVEDSSAATTTVTMDGDKTVTANFTDIAYTLNVQSPSNGTISLKPTSTGNIYGEGTVVTVTASPAPDSHYLFSEWTGDLTGAVSPTTITIDEDKTIGATFVECTKILTMAISPSNSGSTDPAAGENIQTCDEIVPITATPASGYYFVNWTGSEDIEDPNARSTTVTMDEGKSVTANFVEISYTLTMGTSGNGTTTPVAGDHEYGEGAVVSITANPGSGYVFSSWTGDVASSTSASTTITMDEDQTITANFVAASSDDDDGDSGGGGGGGIFGEISIRDVLGYHHDGNRSDGTGVYMPVTSAYKALKGAQTHVEGFAPNIALFIRRGFEFFEQKAESNKNGILYRVGTYSFPVLGKIAEYYLDIVGAEKLKTDAYADTTISIEEFKTLEQQGKAVAPHRVNFEDEPGEESVQE